MATLTIPKELTRKGELVIIPRKEYEEFLRFRAVPIVKEVPLTMAQKKVLARARKNLAAGKYLTIDELKKRLGHPD